MLVDLVEGWTSCFFLGGVDSVLFYAVSLEQDIYLMLGTLQSKRVIGPMILVAEKI